LWASKSENVPVSELGFGHWHQVGIKSTDRRQSLIRTEQLKDQTHLFVLGYLERQQQHIITKSSSQQNECKKLHAKHPAAASPLSLSHPPP
jgi:hypothetical protein